MEKVSAVLDNVSFNNSSTNSQDVYVFPTSFAQQRLWLLDQLEPGSPLYNITSAVKVGGHLDLEALARTFDEIVRRHETLRTTFRLVDEMPVQVIAPPQRLRLTHEDLSQLPQQERAEKLGLLLSAEAAIPFDLSRGPLLRVMVVRLLEDRHVIILTMHHIISDGWSMEVLEREVALLYGSYVRGLESPLPELEIQYADYAMWQREWLQGEVLERELGYWREQLSGELPVLELPIDGVRPARQTYNGASLRFELSPAVTRGVGELSRAQSSTLFMTLLAAFQTLLYRYSGQQDILVGTPIAGRNRAEIEPLIGFFVNTLVLRTDLSGDPSFVELLARVRDVTLGAYAHQELPFEMLVEEFQPERDVSRSPLVQVLFALQNAGQEEGGRKPESDSSGLRMKPLRTETPTAKFELTMSLEEAGERLRGTLEYNTDIFASASMERMIGHWQNLVAAVVENLDEQISRIQLLNAAEQRQLLVDWNDTAVEYPRDLCLQELFEAQVERTPQAVAVEFGDEHLTYDELNRRANQLARRLRTLGIGPAVLAGIYVERSLDMAVGLLGILKAGGAFVPLDPGYPADRVKFMLDDARVKVLLTQQHLRATLPEIDETIFCLDADWPSIAELPDSNLEQLGWAENMAYVIYTSGSTGRPKGVSIPHNALINHVLSVITSFRLKATDRALQFAPLSFDYALEEMFPIWLIGATLVLRPPAVLSGAEFWELVRARKLSVISLVPSYWQEVMSDLLLRDEELPESVRLVVIGGENASAAQWEQWRRLNKRDVRLINHYGPTETTVMATLYEVPADMVEAGLSIPIGRAISNTEVYVLDEHRELVGVGIPGELYIGGRAVGRGYLRRTDETAARFVPDDCSGRRGARLYRTGDVVRWRAEGELEFVRRLDEQVKIRGHRIELGEIESVLLSHEDVREAIVVGREGASGDQQLIAYVVAEVSAADLREHLAQSLPAYMLPAAIILLDHLPLTLNGKIDKRALPEPVTERAETSEGPIAPQDSLEVQLINIWESVLQVSPISVRDNFFSLGGHSLDAVHLVSQIHARIGQDLPVAAVFENPTIDQLASILRERNWPGVLRLVDDLPQVDSPLVSIQPSGTKPPLFFVSALGGILPSNVISSVLDLAPHLDRDQPFYGLQLPGLIQPLACHFSSNVPVDEVKLAEIFFAYMRENPPLKIIRDGAARCVEAMRQIQPDGPYHLVGFCSGGIVAFEVASQLMAAGEEVGLLVVMDTATPSAWVGDVAPRVSIESQITPANETQVDPDVKRIGWFVCKDLAGSRLRVDLEEVYRELAMRSGDERWEYALELLKSGGEVGAETTAEDVRRLFLIYNVNSDSVQFILQRYRPQHYSGKLTLFRINDFSDVGDDLSLGWSRFVSEPVDVQIVDGDHGTFFHGENLVRLAQRLTVCLEQAQAS